MCDALIKLIPTVVKGCIKNTKDISDDYTTRIRICFKNGRELSLIRGQWSYGGREGLYEIMPFGIKADVLFDKEDRGDDVLGHLTKERVQYYIKKIAGVVKKSIKVRTIRCL